jgi:uncharacterized protein
MHPYFQALAGGLIMGAASALLLIANGRILGISGVLGGALRFRTTEARWRWAFVLGMLVGVGTQLGSGCASGHGICGIGRMSKRSVFATVVFIASGAATVLVVRYFFDGVV